MSTLKTINDGALVLLEDACTLLGEQVHDVLIIGGWGTYIRNKDRHPGTKDVDILFPVRYSREQMGEVIRRFIDSDYMISAKHGFQILKPIQIGSRKYLFNIDFLHPMVDKQDICEFQDVIQLDETIDGRMVKTVITAGILQGQIFHEHELSEELTEGSASFRGLNGSGIVISKIMSCMNPKRTRDIYDMCLEWNHCPDEISKDIIALHGEYAEVAKWVRSLASFIDEKPDYFPRLLEWQGQAYGIHTEVLSAYHNFTAFMRKLGD